LRAKNPTTSQIQLTIGAFQLTSEYVANYYNLDEFQKTTNQYRNYNIVRSQLDRCINLININQKWLQKSNLDDPRKQLGDLNTTTYSISTIKPRERANLKPTKLRLSDKKINLSSCFSYKPTRK
jgi:hypothetical protein